MKPLVHPGEIDMRNVSEEKMAIYRASAQKRWDAEAEDLSRRYENLWALARNASIILKEQFGAERVAVFGSLVNKDLFHLKSDVDLAVWGMEEKVYFRAVSQLLSMAQGIGTDLVRIEDAKQSLIRRIENEGVEI